MPRKRTKPLAVFGTRFREALAKSRFQTKTAFLREIEMQPMTLYRYETGANVPSSAALARIATALDVSSDWLMGRDEVVVYDRDAEPPPPAFFEYLERYAPADITEDEKEMLRDMRARGGRFTPQSYSGMLAILRGTMELTPEQQAKVNALDDV